MIETVYFVFLVVSVLLTGVALGLIVPFLFEVKKIRTDMSEKVAVFDEITRKASEANLSHANKLLQLEDKVANFEFRLQTTIPTSNFKAK